MKTYLLKRIILAVVSFFIVVGTVMILCYSAIDRTAIFATDTSYVKYSDNEKTMYEYQKYQQYGYLEYTNYGDWVITKYKNKYGEDYPNHEDYIAANQCLYASKSEREGNVDYVEFTTTFKAKNHELIFLPAKTKKNKSGEEIVYSRPYYVAKIEKNVFDRIGQYFGSMFRFETTNDVKDPNLTERGMHWEWDKRSNMPALVGSGTEHKYLIYFDDKFPFVHQNLFHFNLGTSYVLYKNDSVSDVITTNRGDVVFSEQEYPSQVGTGITHVTSYDFHTVTYNGGPKTDIDKEMYVDNYTNAKQNISGLSMLANSFVIGLIATFIAYLIGLPLGIWMAQRKDKAVDKIGNLYIIFIMAVPSLAYIFIFAAIGCNLFGLPYKFANAEVMVLAYILPTISLALPSIGNLMKWMRRYMIDQMNSDYVKFARSQGLSNGEIFSKHIFPNAFIYFVQGIPANILGCLTGAIITERVYSVPGVGNLLTNAINKYDNGVIVACTAFYTFLGIISIILGDLLLAKYDPRISLSEGGRS